MVRRLFLNPVFTAALLIAFLVYCGVLKIRKDGTFRSVFKSDEIISFNGFIESNPIKTTFSGSYFYRTAFETQNCLTKSGGTSACTGNAVLFFPVEIVESFYPGKIYTSSKKDGVLVENGAALKVKVEKIKSAEENFFKVTEAKNIGWKGNVFQQKFYRFRGICRLQFKRLMYSWGKAGGLILALFSGSRDYTEKELSDGFRNTGLSHILAISGMHLSLFGGTAFLLGKKLSSRNIADAIRLMAVIFFVLFAGSSPSLFRAFLSCLILYLNSLLRMNRPTPLTLISACFLIHIMIFPSHMQEIAFMLSYASLSGIIIVSDIIKRLIHPLVPYRIRKSLSDSSSAQIFTAPLAIHFFSRVMPVGIIAAVIVSPVVTLFIYAGMAGIIICLALPILSVPISAIMNCLYQILKFLVLLFERI